MEMVILNNFAIIGVRFRDKVDSRSARQCSPSFWRGCTLLLIPVKHLGHASSFRQMLDRFQAKGACRKISTSDSLRSCDSDWQSSPPFGRRPRCRCLRIRHARILKLNQCTTPVTDTLMNFCVPATHHFGLPPRSTRTAAMSASFLTSSMTSFLVMQLYSASLQFLSRPIS